MFPEVNKIMKKYITSVTIGIPAFNEQENIGYLISELLSQKQTNFRLDQIIVSSDGSNDQTVQIASTFGEKICVLENKKRQGVAIRQNQIFRKSNSDILVLLNADIAIKDRRFIEKLVKPIRQKRADLTSSKITELPPANFIEGVINQSMKIKKSVFEQYRSSNNIYTCHGPVRAFSKPFYKKITFKNSVGEDAYSYLYCIYYSFKYVFVKNTEVFYKLPGSFADHQKQSLRFFQGQKLMALEFGSDFVSQNYKTPIGLLLWATLKALLINPLQTFSYLVIVLFLKFKSNFIKNSLNTWDVSKSSKVLRLTQ